MITFIKGRSGRGKTTYIFDAIDKKIAKQQSEKIFLIVPDQMSFQTEYQLLSRQKKNAMFNVEIVGISRFVSRLLEEFYPIEFSVFDSLAQKMLLQYSVSTLKDELNIYNKNINHLDFIDSMQQFYRQIRGSNLSLEEVLSDKDFASRPLLNQRLTEMMKIFALYEQNREQMSFDYADKLDFFLKLLSENIITSKLKDITIYVDGFHIYNHQEREVLLQVLKYVNEGMVTFCLDDHYDQTSFFSIVHKQMQYFTQEFPTAMIVDLNKNAGRYTNNPSLDLFEVNYEHPQKVLSGDDFSVVSCLSQEHEVERAALGIRKQLLAGVKAKEIALYVPNKENYAQLIEQYFDEYEIPYFIDLKDKMLYHPLFQWINALVNIISFNWRYEDLLDLSQNKYFWWRYEIEEKDYYIFLTHINRNKLYYQSMWEDKRYWSYFDHPAHLEKTIINEEKTNIINKIRQAVLTEITIFDEALNAATIEDILQEIYLLTSFDNQIITFFETLKNELPSYANHLLEADYHQAVWEEFVHILEQLAVAFKDLKPTKETLLDGFKLGIESSEFSAVPLGFDGVMIGDFERSRFQTLSQDEPINMGVSHIYILGMVEGVLPHAENMSGMLSEQDILYLHHQKIFDDVLSETEQTLYQLFRFYLLITNTKKTITVSYYQNASLMSLEEQLPATLITDLLSFGFSEEVFEISSLFNDDFHVLTMATMKRLVSRYHQDVRFKSSKLYRFSHTQPKLKELLHTNSIKKDNHVPNAQLPKSFSLSQIETFNRCEYQYFLKYVLKVKEPVENHFLLNQSGTLMHGGFEESINAVVGKKVTSQPLEFYYETIEQYFEKTKIKLADHPLFQSATNAYIYQRILETTKLSFSSYFENEQFSRFVPKSLEHELMHEFTVNNQKVPLLGKVDRIDISDDGNYIRIIDYKSSNKKLDFDSLYYGEQLQLPFYSYLVDKKASQIFAGALYVPMTAALTSVDGVEDVDALKQKSTKQTGFFLEEKAAITKFDTQLEADLRSNVITYALKKDGSPNAHSTSFSSNELLTLEEYAIGRAQTTVGEILNKSFKVEPLRLDKEEKSSPCTFCQFKSICQFDSKRDRYNDKRRKFGTGTFQEKKATFVATSKEEQK